jgi:uncharacterized lipoprotein YddW (UPF0748 family)
MNRRTFLSVFGQKTSGTAVFLFLNNLVTPARVKKRESRNWVWITPDLQAKDDDWKKNFEKLKNANFTGIIPEIYDGRNAYFSSSRLPVKAEYMEKLIPVARSFDLEVHAWMWCMPCLIKDIQDNHADWYTVNRLRQSSAEKPAYVDYYKFLCPAREEVHEFIQATVKELALFDIDGIHLDYIRYPDVILAKGLWSKYNIVQDREYPEYDYCYCGTCRKKFKDQTGTDPLEIEEPATHSEWLQFRYDQVTNLVNNTLIPVGRERGKIMSAAVFPNWRNVRQEWRNWKLDAVFPMNYNTFYLGDAEWIKQYCIEEIKSLRYDIPLYSGLFIDDVENFRQYVIKSFEGGATGISVFSMNNLTDTHYNMLAMELKEY